MSRKYIIQNKLQNSDRNLKIVDVVEEREIYRVIGKLTYRLTSCSYCHTKHLVKNGFKTVYIRDIPYNEKPVIIQLSKQRFLCTSCHHSIIAQTSLVNKRSQLSKRLKKSILQHLTKDISVDEIAQSLNISPISVNRIVDELHNQFVHPKQNLPTHLSFDEVRTTHQQMSFLAINAETGELVTLLPDRLTKNIIDHFERCYSLTARRAVKSVVLDFNSSYHRFIHRLFPNAEIVADRFHLKQMINRVISQTRVNIMRQLKWNSREYRLLKNYWRLYLKPFHALDYLHVYWRKHLKDRLTEEQIVIQGIHTNPKFAQVYYTAQSLSEAIDNNDCEKLLSLIKSKTDNQELNTLLRTFKLRLKSIFKAMVSPLSNGRIEGIIRKIKQISRTAYGYRNWQHLRDRIFIEFKLKTKKRKPIRK